MGKVIPVPVLPGPEPGPEPGPNFFFWPGPGPKFFVTRTSTKIFSEQDRHQNLFLKRPGPTPETFSRRDQDQNFFLAGTGTGTGTKNDWSRSCLIKTQKNPFHTHW